MNEDFLNLLVEIPPEYVKGHPIPQAKEKGKGRGRGRENERGRGKGKTVQYNLLNESKKSAQGEKEKREREAEERERREREEARQRELSKIVIDRANLKDLRKDVSFSLYQSCLKTSFILFLSKSFAFTLSSLPSLSPFDHFIPHTLV